MISTSGKPPSDLHDERARLSAALISLVVGSVLLAVKFIAYRFTGSTAILSDALESIVNVVAALFALSALVFAGRPADRNHPYGHGKIEFFSATFEGGLISFAAVLIIYQAMQGLLFGTKVQSIDLGVLLTIAAGLVNAGLGWFLLRIGRQQRSSTLIADGQHVLSDFWTSLGVAAGLELVAVTDMPIFDPLVALLVGINLVRTGYRLVRHAAGALLDEEDAHLLEQLVAAINANISTGIIRVHFLRAIRAGRFTHADAHLVVPEFWTVEQAHEAADAFERRVLASLEFDGELAFHTDPCRQLYCAACDVEPCPIRLEPFVERNAITLQEAVRRDALPARVNREPT